MNDNKRISFFTGSLLSETLKNNYRVYLCGNLSMPQDALECIHDDKLEIGTSYYKDYKADVPHYHEKATEYNFIVCGSVKVFLYEAKETFEFEAGSIYVLPPNTKYASKNAPGTQVLFVKCPGGNDKILYDYDENLKNWMKSWDV